MQQGYEAHTLRLLGFLASSSPIWALILQNHQQMKANLSPNFF
jgi:hypothetical protein